MKTVSNGLVIGGILMLGTGVMNAQQETKPEVPVQTKQAPAETGNTYVVAFELKVAGGTGEIKTELEKLSGIQAAVTPGQAAQYGYGGDGTNSRPRMTHPFVPTRIRMSMERGTTLWLSQVGRVVGGTNINEATLTVPSETVLHLSGLSCEACDKTMTKELKAMKGYVSSHITIRSEKESYAVVRFEKDGTPVAALRDVVKTTPFTLEDVKISGVGAAEASGETEVVLAVRNAAAGGVDRAAGALKGIGGVKSAEGNGTVVRVEIGTEGELWLNQVNQALGHVNSQMSVDEVQRTLRAATEVKLSGMKCDACKKILEKELGKLSGYRAMAVEIKSEKEAVARIRFEGKREPSLSALRKAVSETPFALEDVKLAGVVTAPPEPPKEEKK